MTPTGRNIDPEKLRKKLQEEAKTVEEKRLLQEALLSYVEYLREKRSEVSSDVRSYLYAVYVTVPLALASLIVTAMAHIHKYVLLVSALKFSIIIATAICAVLVVAIYLRERMRNRLERIISEVYDVLIDPVMKPDTKEALKSPRFLIALTLAIIVAIIAAVAWALF